MAREEIATRMAASVASGRPHVVLVVVDTLRADWTTPYGFEVDTTPELARWARRGVLFERARAQSSWTKISMASLMTSLWPRTHGIRDVRDGLGEAATTLAEVLRGAGYATYGVQSNGWLHQSFGFHQGFDRYLFPHGGAGGPARRASVWPHAERIYEEAVRLLDAHDTERPLFLYLHFMDVHEYAAPPEFKRYGTGDRGAYLAAIRWVDATLERLRRRIEDAGLADRTLMVFAADHGETFGEHGVHGHGRNVLTPVLHVPLVLRLPFPVEPVRVASQVRIVDLAPTILELAGVPVPERFEGRSLVPLLTGGSREGDRPSYAALGTPLFADAAIQDAVNDGRWTYARNAPADGAEGSGARRPPGAAPGEERLFDRRVDPGENVDLVGIETAQAARLRALLDAHQQRDAEAVARPGVRIDPGIAERLRAMGYLEARRVPAGEPATREPGRQDPPPAGAGGR